MYEQTVPMWRWIRIPPIIQSDKKGTWWLGVSMGDINIETWSSRLGVRRKAVKKWTLRNPNKWKQDGLKQIWQKVLWKAMAKKWLFCSDGDEAVNRSLIIWPFPQLHQSHFPFSVLLYVLCQFSTFLFYWMLIAITFAGNTQSGLADIGHMELEGKTKVDRKVAVLSIFPTFQVTFSCGFSVDSFIWSWIWNDGTLTQLLLLWI